LARILEVAPPQQRGALAGQAIGRIGGDAVVGDREPQSGIAIRVFGLSYGSWLLWARAADAAGNRGIANLIIP